jgi:hypothetical protein
MDTVVKSEQIYFYPKNSAQKTNELGSVIIPKAFCAVAVITWIPLGIFADRGARI